MRSTYSDTMPVIQRLQGKILFPADIELVDRPDGEGQCYRYRLIRIEDHGQDISDRDEFASAHYAALRRHDYGDFGDQLDKMYHGEWTAHMVAVKERWPKPEEV